MKLMHSGGGVAQDPREWASVFADWNCMSLKGEED